MQDKDWLKKCLIMGLLALIPIVGMLNALGWMRSTAEARLRGETDLPEAGLSYIGAGWRVFVMLLPIVGLLIALYIVVGVIVFIGAATDLPIISAIGSIVAALIFLPVMLWLTVFQPSILYIHIVHGDPWASMRFKQQWALVKATGTEYLLLWVAFLLCGIIGQAGAIACGIGLLVSLTYGQAMQGAALAEFARITKKA